MSEPIILVSNQRIKAGQLEAYKENYRQTLALLKGREPYAVGHVAFLNEEGTEATVVHIFPDAESMAVHLRAGADELARQAFQYMDITSLEIYGRPSEDVMETMKAIAGSGVTVIIKPQYLEGYIRLTPD